MIFLNASNSDQGMRHFFLFILSHFGGRIEERSSLCALYQLLEGKTGVGLSSREKYSDRCAAICVFFFSHKRTNVSQNYTTHKAMVCFSFLLF